MKQKKMIGKEIKIYPGKVMKFNDLNKIKDRNELTKFLKFETYKLREK